MLASELVQKIFFREPINALATDTGVSKEARAVATAPRERNRIFGALRVAHPACGVTRHRKQSS